MIIVKVYEFTLLIGFQQKNERNGNSMLGLYKSNLVVNTVDD